MRQSLRDSEMVEQILLDYLDKVVPLEVEVLAWLYYVRLETMVLEACAWNGDIMFGHC